MLKCPGTGCDLKSVCHRYVTPDEPKQEYFDKPPMKKFFTDGPLTGGWQYECPEFWVTDKYWAKWNKLSDELKKLDRRVNGG